MAIAKVTKKVSTLGDSFFYVYKDTEVVKCLFFKPGDPEESVFAESKALAEAMTLVKIIESDDIETISTVYETKS